MARDFRNGLIGIAIIAAACYFAFGGRLPWSGGYEIWMQVRSGNRRLDR